MKHATMRPVDQRAAGHGMGKWLLGAAIMGAIGMASPSISYGEGLTAAEALDGAISIKSQEAVQYVPVKDVESKVPWTPGTMQIDGNLSDWSKLGAPAVVLAGKDYTTWFKGDYKGAADLSASVWLCRDDHYLYVAVKIEDDQLPSPERINIGFADGKTKPIHGWRDVGARAGADDVDNIFVLGKDGKIGLYWSHIQTRMDTDVAQNSFGSESERLALLEQGQASTVGRGKIISRMSRQVEGGKSVTYFEAAYPWATLMPYSPVSYQPLKFNISVQDKDGEGADARNGAVAWLPGIVGTYDAGHWVNLTFAPAPGRSGVETWAQVPAFNYINQNVSAEFSFYNHGAATEGEAELLSNGKVVVTSKVKLPAGYSATKLVINSEKLDAGRDALQGRLTVAGQKPVEVVVHAPSADSKIAVHKVAEYEAKIATLKKNTQALDALYAQVKAKGLDTTYPLAYLTLEKMFIPRSELDLKAGDSVRVTMNTDFLESLYTKATDYMQTILKDPSKQLKMPPRFDPAKLVMKDGYYFDGDRPVFLWGPCVFWYLRQDQPQVIDLGFNSVTTEVPQDASNPEVKAQMEAWYKAGISVNATILAPSVMATGADAKRLGFLKEHPEVANVDQNNFLPFLVQSPIAREMIKKDFWKHFPHVRSYWLWNEPWYLNYSETTRQDFIKNYLEPKYKTVDALNKVWKSHYKSFNDIQLIQWPDANNYAPWYDFQQFRDDLLGNFWAFLNKTAKDLDPSKPTHVKFMAASLHSGNMEKYQQPFDIAGHDGSSSDRDIVFMDYMRSLFPTRPLVDTEVHIYYGGRKPVEMTAWRLALHGLADGNWWCWHSNQRFSDSLANAISMNALTMSGLDIQRLFDPYMYDLNMKPTNVAILFPDVVERRSDVKMVRMRFELAPALYELGVRPFYVAEDRIPTGELSKHKLLLASESDYTKESTYQGVLAYVKNGGTAVVMRGGFAHDEYGNPRDASELIQLKGGEAYGPDARIYPLGKGKVICIDAIENQADIVVDGGQALRGSPTPENLKRRTVYRLVMAKSMTDLGLNDDVRIVSRDGAENASDQLNGFDWRSAPLKDGGYTLAVLPYGTDGPFDVKLQTVRPIAKITNLLTDTDVPVDGFKLENGPNLFRIELKK